MKEFLIVLKFELNNYFKNKSFVLTTIGLAVLAAALIIVPTLIPGFLKKDSAKEDTVQEEMAVLALYSKEESAALDGVRQRMPAAWQIFQSPEEVKDAVRAEEAEAGFLVDGTEVTYVVNNLQMTDQRADQFQAAYSACLQQAYYLQKGLTVQELSEGASIQAAVSPEILGKNSAKNYWYTYILVFAVYFLIIFYGQMIAVSVTNEKSNRAIEILVTSVNSNSLICGKVLAGAISGVIQMGIILGGAFAAYGFFGDAWGGRLDFLMKIPAKVLIAFVVFEMLSYLLYAFIFGMLGAMVSKTEDISKSASTVTMLYVVSFLIAVFGMMQNSDSLMMKIASFVPLTSGNAMFIRVSMGGVAMWEILLSFLLLAGSCVLIGVLAAKMFRFATLHYGNPLKFRKALKAMRESR